MALVCAEPQRLLERLAQLGLRRAWLAPRDGGWRSSHRGLGELAEFLAACPDQRGHQAVFLAVGARSGALLGAFLHDLTRGQAQGGLRLQPYASLEAYLRDGLRLAWGMGRKSALAGLWWSGGKGLIARPPGLAPGDAAARRALFLDYGDFVSSLDGVYVTAEDAGTGPEDVATVFERTRFVTCVPEAFGGAGNPSRATARGVACGMEAALGALGRGKVAGARVAIQGAGQVGAALVDELLARGVGAVALYDVSPERCRELAFRWDAAPVSVRCVPPGDPAPFAEPCDVLAPCALGGVLGPATIPRLKTRLVCGSANNPLEDEARDAAALAAAGIAYVPDYVVNRMGIVRCADEASGRLDPDPAVERHLDPAWEHSIPAVVRQVLEAAQRERVPTTRVAERRAERLLREPHPLWPGRARAIAEALLSGRWCDAAARGRD